ncbi:hypothetical protein DYB37_001381 [Aphanomyces astaci]|uniref:ornithine carbamoyltransferase n=1 Tax=Aphanomyces astaci TaxID=112090 RepID=A0A418F150_APHAT|nr:hypothetical protein DYB37_001381 [Aphanomyces astaci]
MPNLMNFSFYNQIVPCFNQLRIPTRTTKSQGNMLRRTLTSQFAIHRRSGAACISTSRLPIPRKFLSTDQLSSDQFQHLLDTAIDFKKRNIENTVLQGETLLMIFQKRSTRTRLSSEIGMQRLGGRALFLSSDDIQLGVNESLKDSARVMSRFGSILLARVHGHGDVKKLADESSIPVINALSDKFHPLQALADYMTIQVRICLVRCLV